MMKKLFLLVLTLMLALSMSAVSFAENADDVNSVKEEDLLTAEQLAEAISAADAEEAYISWAKTCAAVIINFENAAYDCATGIYGYATGEGYTDQSENVQVLRKMIQAEDLWELNISIPRNNTKKAPYVKLNNAVIGYKNMVTYNETLQALLAVKPEVPAKYAQTASWITTAATKLQECIAAVDSWVKTGGSTMDLWGKMEGRYWDKSILSLHGIYYIDSRLGN